MIYPPGKSFCSFGLREDEWIKHLLIVGMSGAGKTNLTFQILRELKEKTKPFLVFDWKKNYRDLRQLPEFKDLIVFTVSRKRSATISRHSSIQWARKPWLQFLLENRTISVSIRRTLKVKLVATRDESIGSFGG